MIPLRESAELQFRTTALAGWVGALPTYDGNVWELHPLVVSRSAQRQGIGRALVQRLEQEVRIRGGLTLWLGTDANGFGKPDILMAKRVG